MLLPSLTRELVRSSIDRDLPAHGSGRTIDRWRHLRDIARVDLALVKLVEPHHDAWSILRELDGPIVAPDDLWAVWAAEPPTAVLEARPTSGSWRLDGEKAFCSGAEIVTRALVTARTDEGSRLFAIDTSDHGISIDPTSPAWAGPGMSRARTVGLRFDDVRAEPVGRPGDYVDRPGFWWGSIAVASCWVGGAQGVADALEERAGRLDAHAAAHLGAARAARGTVELALESIAGHVDSGHLDAHAAERLALTIRSSAADLVEATLSHVGRALGPGPLAFDAEHAARVADLQVFVRQHHAERDLARLGTWSADD